MKGTALFLLIAAVVLAFAAAHSLEMAGVVTAVDLDRNVLTLKAGKTDVHVYFEAGSLMGIKGG